MHELSKNSVFTVGLKICILQLMELGNIGIAVAEMKSCIFCLHQEITYDQDFRVCAQHA